MPTRLGGLPEDVNPWEDLEAAEARFEIRTESRRYGKIVTIVEIEGLGEEALEELARELKSKAAAGGTLHGRSIELQGDHRRRVREILESRGFSPKA